MVADPDYSYYGTKADHKANLSSKTNPSRPRLVAVEQVAFAKVIAKDADDGKSEHRLGHYEVLTLDCYGTLVDRDSGIVSALMPWLNEAGVTAGRGEIVRAFGQAERAKLVTAPGVCYRDVLLEAHESLAQFFEIKSDRKSAEAFASSIKDWPLHPDVREALAYLKKHVRLVMLTNIDHLSFAQTFRRLGVEFDAVYTAEDIGSYKPSMRSFDYLLGRLRKAGIDKQKVLHIASSLRFDHIPAKRKGMHTCWINRPHGQSRMKEAMTRGLDEHPDYHFESLSDLVRAHAADIAQN